MRVLGSQVPRILAGAVALALLAGCASVKVFFGYRVRLAKTPVVSMEASLQTALQSGPALAPGQRAPLVVKLAGRDGVTYVTEGAGEGKVLWEDLKVEPEVVSVDARGRVTMPADPRLSEGRAGRLVVTVPSQPALRAELDIPVRYDAAFKSEYRGAAGWSGSDGSAGMDGSSGSNGSSDPDHPSPGGSGGSGGNGSDGQDGGDGGNGPAVTVRLALRPGPQPLIMASCEAEGRRTWFLVDPRGGSLTVSSLGGPGGPGGRGGAGGRGGSGGNGSPSGSSGSDGSSGRSGWDGRPGADGAVEVVYDPAVKPYVNAIRIITGLRGGITWIEAPVGPLW